VDQHVGGDGLEGVARFRLHRSLLHLVIALCGGLAGGRCKEKQVCPVHVLKIRVRGGKHLCGCGSLGLDIPEAPRGAPGGEARMARQERHLPQRGRAGGARRSWVSLTPEPRLETGYT
jgi:hypothetical protein